MGNETSQGKQSGEPNKLQQNQGQPNQQTGKNPSGGKQNDYDEQERQTPGSGQTDKQTGRRAGETSNNPEQDERREKKTA